MKNYSASFANSGEDMGNYNYEELLSFLNSNRAEYDESVFETESGTVELKVSGFENIIISW